MRLACCLGLLLAWQDGLPQEMGGVMPLIPMGPYLFNSQTGATSLVVPQGNNLYQLIPITPPEPSFGLPPMGLQQEQSPGRFQWPSTQQPDLIEGCRTFATCP